jgi:protein arginine N-methyltransferase 6
VSALVPLAKKFTSEEPSIEIIGGENVLSWPFVVKHIDCYTFKAEELKSFTTKYKVSSMMLGESSLFLYNIIPDAESAI